MDAQQYADYKRKQRNTNIKTGFVFFGVALVASSAVSGVIIYGQQRAASEKRDFTNSCTSIHGYTFTDSDNYNCLVNGRILFKTAK